MLQTGLHAATKAQHGNPCNLDTAPNVQVMIKYQMLQQPIFLLITESAQINLEGVAA
jgi:hypothetical protein